MSPPIPLLWSLSKSHYLVLNVFFPCFTGSVTPPPKDDRVIYETKAEVQRREVIPDRRRSPGPAIDPDPPAPRRERPTRFGPGPSSVNPAGANGLPMKPTTAPDDRPRELRRGNSERQHERRVDQDRRYEDTVPQAPVYATPAGRSSVNARESDRLWVPAPDASLNRSENTGISCKSYTSAMFL